MGGTHQIECHERADCWRRIPHLLRELEDRRLPRRVGVVDEGMQHPESCHGGGRNTTGAGDVGDVALEVESRPRCSEFCKHPFPFVLHDDAAADPAKAVDDDDCFLRKAGRCETPRAGIILIDLCVAR